MKSSAPPRRARFAGVVIEGPLSTVYHYRIPARLAGRVAPGARVQVPFGPRRAHGFVVSVCNEPPIAEERIKDLHAQVRDEALATPEILELTRWMADYYRCGWGEVLAAAVPQAVRQGTDEKTVLHAELAVDPEQGARAAGRLARRAPRQAAALGALLEAGGPLTLAQIQALVGASRPAIKSLADKGLVTLAAVAVHPELASVSGGRADVTLTEGQQAALDAILPQLDRRAFGAFLLHGATASGKTEVYLRALAHCLAQGRTAVVLVPEISLTPQTVERFRARAGEVALLHSHMAHGARAAEWRRLRRGEVRVAIGARSAVFAPVPDLGLVIVDEEHERTFKQEIAPRYHARDVAVLRAQRCGAAVILGSATPSLESFQNARAGKYALLRLPERVAGARLPETALVDLRAEWSEVKGERLLSRRLEREVRARLAAGEQAILFLNRRGFHTWVHCRHCGQVLECPQCDISLTFHRKANRVRCHYCGHDAPAPDACPSCGAPGLRFAGTGTERAAEVVAGLFPDARLLRMDSDTMSGRDSHARALSAFARGEYDILLGTQMVAKGHDFPGVTLIGVLFADGSLNLPDFRAAEQTFQLVMQVVGRCGRGERPGLGVVQAFDPRQSAVRLAADQDYDAFAERELADRRAHGYPPFGRLARVLVRGPDRGKVLARARDAADTLRQAAPPGAVLGPAPCAIARMHGQARVHVLVKAPTANALAAVLDAAQQVQALRDRGKVRLSVDIDPVSLL